MSNRVGILNLVVKIVEKKQLCKQPEKKENVNILTSEFEMKS